MTNKKKSSKRSKQSHPELNNLQLLEVCRRDPNVFNSFVLGIKQGPLHLMMQNHLTAHDDCYIELPRGHGKTTQISGRAAYEIGNNPNIRIKYVMQNKDEASKTTAMVRDIISSPRYQKVFPWINVTPERSGRSAIQVERDKTIRDDTIEGCGIFGRASGRYDICIFDDVCDLQNAVQKPGEREKVKESYANTYLPMADRTSGYPVKIWKVGTCYHIADITADWRDSHTNDNSLMRMPVVDYKGPWPEGWTEEQLRTERERMGQVAFARAYELSPVSSEILVFPSEWVMNALYEPENDEFTKRGNRIAAIDWAYSKDKMGDNPDYSVMIVATKTFDGHIYIEDVIRARATYPEFKRQAISMGDRYGVTNAIVEGGGPQKGIAQDFTKDACFPVTVVTRVTDKITRATEVQPFVESGKLHLQSKPARYSGCEVSDTMKIIYNEITMFPAGDHDDTVDCVVDLCNDAMKNRREGRINRIANSADERLSGIYG